LGIDPQRFLVINCVTKLPDVEVTLLEYKYIALSYVWGQDCVGIDWFKVVLDAVGQ
jgi:hypothetical protein